ncbi:MAG: LysR family transcriptional regulator [Solobacterium sp.]|nr:LysR family transcriptional regulator [Solobacterium sp.]
MLNLKYLETFIRTAEAGSFRKAADLLYLTPSALIKQVDALEDEVGTALFERTPRGLKLTAAGASLLHDGRFLLAEAEAAIARARQTVSSSDSIINVGSSPVTGTELIIDLLYEILPEWPELRVQVIPFVNEPGRVSELFAKLGTDIDLITGSTDAAHLAARRCSGLTIETIPLCLAVPRHHPLSAKKKAAMEDLAEEKVFVLSKGKMEVMDKVQEDLKQRFPDISLVPFDFFGMDVFNRVVQENAVLVSTEHWLKAHPMLRKVDADWPYTAAYGILYARNPSAKIRRLLALIQKQRHISV